MKISAALLSLFAVAAVALVLTARAGEAPGPGDPAPAFHLQDQNGEWHRLEDYQGRWLAVYFYPKDDTPGCTTEACSFRDSIYAFEAIDAAVVGISVDDVDSHKAFSDKYKIPFTLLSDTSGATAEAYGVLRDYKLTKLASRQSFIVDPEGRIVRHYSKVVPEEHTAEILEAIQTLRAAATGS